jgi:hypothetical protein
MYTTPVDISNPVTRGLIAMLAFAKYGRKQIAACFGTCEKTVTRILGELKSGHLRLSGEKDGIQDLVIRYLVNRYRDLFNAKGGQHDHGSFELLRKEVFRYLEVDLSHEYVRVLLKKHFHGADGNNGGGGVDGPDLQLFPEPPVRLSNIPEPFSAPSPFPPSPAASSVGIVVPLNNEEDRNAVPSPMESTVSGAAKSNDLSLPPAPEGTPCGNPGVPDPPSGTVPAFHPGYGLPEGRPVFLNHAGHLVVSPWFESMFGGFDPILRQTGAQIMQGAVNQESARRVVCNNLEPLVGPVRQDPSYQRVLLDELPDRVAARSLVERNISLLNSEIGPMPGFYYDPHVESYTGDRKILCSWNGAQKRVEPALVQDFVHTSGGWPVISRVSDGYDEARDRFFIIRELLLELLPEESRIGITWIQDRGFWGFDFMKKIAGNGNFFIQWEKGWKGEDSSIPVITEGAHTITRLRNHDSDIVRIHVKWKVQHWETDEFPGGRRIIVTMANGKTLSIVTNAAHLAEATVIEFMFGRWNQEGDFAMENRHYGINQLTSRKFISYEKIAGSLNDRQVKSRKVRMVEKKLEQIRKTQGSLLIKLGTTNRTTPEKADEEQECLRGKIRKIEQETAEIPPQYDPEIHGHAIRKMEAEIKELERRCKKYRKQRKKATTVP